MVFPEREIEVWVFLCIRFILEKRTYAELETGVQIAAGLSYIDLDQLKWVLDKTGEIGRMLNGLRRSLQSPKVSFQRSGKIRDNWHPPADECLTADP